MDRLKKRMVSRVVYLVWALGIILLAYLPDRSDFWLLTINFAVVFACYWIIIEPTNKIRLKSLLLIAVLTRLVLIPATPSLSDDMYRYVWDGQISLSLENPYEKTPAEWMESERLPRFLDTTLYTHLNSPDYYSVYPPLTQLVFGTGVMVARGNSAGAVFWTKALIVLIEMSLLFVIVPLLRRLKKDPGMVAIYAFNPLILIEISGNMHLEGLSVVFLALGLMYYQGKRGIRAGLMMGFSAGIKLVPLILIPAMALASNFKQRISFLIASALALMLAFLPLIFKESWINFYSSLSLYFSTFEFNASVYYVLRAVGEWYKGYNWIEVIGPLTSALFAIIYIAFLIFVRRKAIEKSRIIGVLIIIMSLFFIFQTTVHPWYIIPLILLAALSGWRFPLVWSGLIFLSYHTYSGYPYSENLWITSFSYILLLLSVWIFDRGKIRDLFTTQSSEPHF